MRWYKRWYNDGWQDVDEDHIKDTLCVDPTDGREHRINKIDISRMFCIAPAEVRAGHLASTAPYMCISSVYLIAFTHLLLWLL